MGRHGGNVVVVSDCLRLVDVRAWTVIQVVVCEQATPVGALLFDKRSAENQPSNQPNQPNHVCA